MLKRVVTYAVVGGAFLIMGCNVALAWNPWGPFFP